MKLLTGFFVKNFCFDQTVLHFSLISIATFKVTVLSSSAKNYVKNNYVKN